MNKAESIEMMLSAEGIGIYFFVKLSFLVCLSRTTASVSAARKTFTPLEVCIRRICIIILAIRGVKVVRSLASLVAILKYARLTSQAASIGVHSLSCKHLHLALAIKPFCARSV